MCTCMHTYIHTHACKFWWGEETHKIQNTQKLNPWSTINKYARGNYQVSTGREQMTKKAHGRYAV